jgi:hypothetical protein
LLHDLRLSCKQKIFHRRDAKNAEKRYLKLTAKTLIRIFCLCMIYQELFLLMISLRSLRLCGESF